MSNELTSLNVPLRQTSKDSQNIKAYTVLTSRITSDTRGVLPQPALRATKYLNMVRDISVQWHAKTTMLCKTHLAWSTRDKQRNGDSPLFPITIGP